MRVSRVSIPICVASCLLVVLLTWWIGTRSSDFLTPPKEDELKRIRLEAKQTNPTAQGFGNPLATTEQERDITVLKPKYVEQAPKLDDYMEDADQGADHLIELAKLLEADHPVRALACWERVLDASEANDAQLQRAAKSMVRLKESSTNWNQQPESGIPIVIQVGTGPTAAALIEPVLGEVAEFISACSTRVVKVTTQVSAGEEDIIDEDQSPVAMWISGPSSDSPSTDVVSFFLKLEDTEGLREQIQAEVYRLVRAHLVKQGKLRPPPKISMQDSAALLLQERITRLGWKRFADHLQNSP